MKKKKKTLTQEVNEWYEGLDPNLFIHVKKLMNMSLTPAAELESKLITPEQVRDLQKDAVIKAVYLLVASNKK